MSTTILSIRHPVEGSVDIIDERVDVVIKVRWPFDLESDEWVDIIGRFRREDLDQAVATAIAEPGPHTIELGDDRLTLERLGEEFSFDISRGGSMPRSLMLKFPIEHLRTLSAAATRGNEQ